MAEEQKQSQQAAVGEVSLLEQMLDDAKVRPEDEAYGTTALGLKQLLKEMLTPDNKGARVDKKAVDRMIAEKLLRVDDERGVAMVAKGARFLFRYR